MNEPAITIAIPYYERQQFLQRAIDSVFSQTIDNWRLVICDNCSSHNFAAELVAGLGDDRATYYREPARRSRAECFNRSLELAQTDLVVLLHDDDALLPGYGKLMLSASKQFPDAAGFYCRTSIIGADGQPVLSLRDTLKMMLATQHREGVTTLRGEQAAIDLLRANFIYGPSVCFRKSQMKISFASKWDQVLDIDLHLRLLMDERTLVGLNEVAYCYCRHAGQTTIENLHSLRYFEEEAAMFDELAESAEARSWHRAAKVAREKRITKAQLLYQCLANGLRFRWRSARDNIAFIRRLA